MFVPSKKDLILLNPENYEVDFKKKEERLVNKLRKVLEKKHKSALNAYRDDSQMLMRYLKESELDVKKAAEAYAKSVEWRINSHIESFVSTPPPELIELGKVMHPERFMGTDKVGRPVYVKRLQEQHYSESKKRFSPEHVRQWHVLDMEAKEKKCRELTLTTGEWIDSFIHIIDMKGASPLQCSEFARTWKATADITENYYPEIYYKVFIINTSMVFRGVSGMMGDSLKRLTKKGKLVILGKDFEKALRKEIDTSQLYIQYGGKVSHVFPQTKFDWKLYDSKIEKESQAKFGKITQSVDVKNGFKFTKNSRVVRGMLLQWRFRSTQKPILFTCRLETPEERAARLKAIMMRSSSMSAATLIGPTPPASPSDPIAEEGVLGNAPEQTMPLDVEDADMPRENITESLASPCARNSNDSVDDDPPDAKDASPENKSEANGKKQPKYKSKAPAPLDNIQEKKKTDTKKEENLENRLALYSKPRWTNSHKGWCYGSAMVYENATAKICFQPVVRYVVNRKKPEPVKFGVAIKLCSIPPSDGALGSRLIYFVDKREESESKNL